MSLFVIRALNAALGDVFGVGLPLPLRLRSYRRLGIGVERIAMTILRREIGFSTGWRRMEMYSVERGGGWSRG